MARYIQVGFNNSVNADKIVAVLNSESLPARKLTQSKKQAGLALDCTCGRKTKSVIVTQDGLIVLSILSNLTLTARLNDVKDSDIILQTRQNDTKDLEV